MTFLADKLAQRANLTAQLASLDAEIQLLYEAEHPKHRDSEFIIQARKDCERLLKALRRHGHPYKLLKTLLDSPLGIVDYDETIDSVWPEGVRSERSVRSTVDYIINKLQRTRYTISASSHESIQIDVRKRIDTENHTE